MLVDETGLQPLSILPPKTWGVAPGWYEPAPLALQSKWFAAPSMPVTISSRVLRLRTRT